MIELDAAQLAQLQASEQEDFVHRVHVDLVHKFPEMASKSGLVEQLQEANRHALNLGLSDAGARTQFLHQAAWVSGFYRAPAVRAWLTKPGTSVAQQWMDFMALLAHKLGLSEQAEKEGN